MNKHDVIIQAIKDLKSGNFHATAIKVELEAQLGRDEDDWDEVRCQDWILKKLVSLRLAKPNDDSREDIYRHCTGYGDYIEAGALKYAEFYNDGSVDSEFTFTLSLKNPENIMLLPKILDVFSALAEAIDGEFDVDGAGMHMALLNSEDCSYPYTPKAKEYDMFHNFQRSMPLLLPALYFLGTGNDTSRGLSFRTPQIRSADEQMGMKYYAINYGQGALEFRIFDTCYDNPENILDNVVVIRNCMKFWSDQVIKTGLSKITSSCNFGNDGGNKLERFYTTVQHLDLLNGGLNILKPEYYTINELKKQRKFHVTKKGVAHSLIDKKKEAEIEYTEYEQRFGWSVAVRRRQYMYDEMYNQQGRNLHRPPEEVEKEIAPKIEERVKDFIKTKKPIKQYVNEQVATARRDLEGRYSLSES